MNATAWIQSIGLIALLTMCQAASADTSWVRGVLNSNATWTSGNTYIIADNARVAPGAILTVQDGAHICILNGLIANTPSNITGRATLIFDSGSTLQANNMIVNACDASGNVVSVANNGGVVFLGTLRSSIQVSKDNVTNKPWVGYPSQFNVTRLELNYLGAGDSKPIWRNKGTAHPQVIEDWDAISFIGVSQAEWNSANQIISNQSGQNGIDVLNSWITIGHLEIHSPKEDGVNMTSSQVQVLHTFIDQTYVTDVFDRDLFDLEVDWGYSMLQVAQGASVTMNGILGDQIKMRSIDCPPHGLPNGLRQPNYTCQVGALTGPLTIYRWGGVPPAIRDGTAP